ncbi:hypothetical protein V1525DRAFT_88821 [Lipomyces kononenkoae]|uniref:Uncharacterized protein n=1 Tax=Lipomyces kononenkoae TaxID=34357 RepID=A0ACC3SSF1_LIPKO
MSRPTLNTLKKFSKTLALRQANAIQTKAAGDISSVFPSLSGNGLKPLPERFADLQKNLVVGRKQPIVDAWTRLLASLEKETKEIKARGSHIIPLVDFRKDIIVDSRNGQATFKDPEVIEEIRKRGVVVIRNVLDKDVARSYKFDAEKYIKSNPSVVAFPKNNPSVYELYWSPSQLHARSHPNVLLAQKALMSLWHSSENESQLSTQQPLIYADRLRIRLPGDAQFTLGPHIDGGSIERWEDPEYSRVYDKILKGNEWELYDPYDYAHRIDAVTDMYGGGGACSMFRMFQGWMAMSNTGPGEGTLRVYPLLKQATAYVILRPFFDAQTATKFVAPSVSFPNTALGAAQELSPATHPQLELESSMIPVPSVQPGDYVAWHCDTIHSVDARHDGKSDSSVLYIPAVPMTVPNLRYLVRQREAYESLSPPPDFPDAGGKGESEFAGHGSERDFASAEGMRAAGCGSMKWNVADAVSAAERVLIEKANQIVFE